MNQSTKCGIVTVAFIAFMVGICFESIGDLPKNCGTPYKWDLPIAMLILLAIPSICAYLWGKSDGKK